MEEDDNITELEDEEDLNIKEYESTDDEGDTDTDDTSSYGESDGGTEADIESEISHGDTLAKRKGKWKRIRTLDDSTDGEERPYKKQRVFPSAYKTGGSMYDS